MIQTAHEAKVREVSVKQLDDLSEALLDFSVSADLDRWFNNQPNK